MRRARNTTPPMTPQEFRDALDGTGWTLESFCRFTGIRPDRALEWMRGETDIPPQTRTLMIALQSAEARGLVYAAHHAAKQQEDAYVSHGN
ncbi:MAG: hypothetical protein K2Z25_21085 [Beijerinckiaceae bacterium]|nr:hypothetical protein [Beijerinckiaceae bacterium]